MERQRTPHPIRADYAADWIAALAAAGQHRSSTLRGYVSALHTEYELSRSFGSAVFNPLDDPLLRRLLDGIERAKAPQEQQARRDRQAQQAHPLTFDLVKRLRTLHRASDARESMLYAATALAVAASLRPSELLGSSKLPDRALRCAQLELFDSRGEKLRFDSPESAARLTLHLRVSKTDQLMSGQSKEVTAATAVEAVQHWARMRGDGGEARLFMLDGHRLNTYALLRHLRRMLDQLGERDFALSGKSFRRGGASSLALLGVPAEDIARAGWAASSSAWQQHYANHPEVRRARAAIVNAQMEHALSPIKKGQRQ